MSAWEHLAALGVLAVMLGAVVLVVVATLDHAARPARYRPRRRAGVGRHRGERGSVRVDGATVAGLALGIVGALIIVKGSGR